MANYYGPLGPDSGYIPTDASTEGLQIGFSRNIASFRLGQYCLTKPVNRRVGYYRRFNPAVGARLGTNPLADALWAPGADRPNGLKNQTETVLVPYQTIRYDEAVVADRLAVQQASWAVEDANARDIAQIAMTRRTYLAHQALVTGQSTVAVIDASDAGSILNAKFGVSTGNWSSGTTALPFFLYSMQFGMKTIVQAVYGALTGDARNFCLVVNPNTASGMALSGEIQSALAQSIFAGNLVTGTPRSEIDDVIAPYNMSWGLPLYYRGFRIVIEDAVYDAHAIPTTNNLGTGSYIMPDNEAWLLYCPNRLEDRVAKADEPDRDEPLYYPISNSLVSFAYEDFTVEAYDDPRNRRVDAHITYDLQYQVSSPLNLVKFVNCVTA